MRHVQLVIAHATIGPRPASRPLPLRHGTLQVVERSGGAADGSLDWEVVLHTIEVEPLANAVHDLDLTLLVGADDDGLVSGRATGRAVLVRAVDHTLVLRGDGPLDAEADFDLRALLS